jgi:hypothetical protein
LRETATYQIRVRGHLSEGWARRFDEFTVSSDPNGETVLTGTDIDQATLHAAIKRIRALAMELVSVNAIGERDEKKDQQ